MANGVQEVKPVVVEATEVQPQFESTLSAKNLATMLEKARAAKKEELQVVENDFWKPEPGEEIDGIYVGSHSINNRIEHGVERESVTKKGSNIVMRLNGCKSLNEQLKGKEGFYVKIKFIGKQGISGGRSYNDYKVAFLKLT